MSDKLLDFFANIHAEGIHAKGELATKVLISNIELKPKDKVLELGCGTGATILKLSRLYPEVSFYGVDVSEKMVAKAKQRHRFCGSNNVYIEQLKSLDFPFSEDFFDVIYCESVLAIQEGDNLKQMLSACKRVLKPNGKIIFNETIWLDQTTIEVIQKINKGIKENFGLIQANEKYPYLNDWLELLKSIGFKTKKIIRSSSFDDQKKKVKIFNLKSYVFSKTGSLKKYLIFGFYKKWKGYKAKMKEIMKYNVPLMEGVIISAKLIDE